MTDGRKIRGAATRERLIACARDLFGERGYEATTIDAVIDRSGVARGALYHHFQGKAELFDAVAEQVFVEIAQRTGAAARGVRDPLERIRAGSRTWLEMAIDPAIARIALIDPPSALGWERWRALDEHHSLGGLRAGFARLESEHRIPAGEGELFANMLLAALNEAALYIASAADRPAALATAHGAIDTLLDRLAGAA